MSSNTVNQEQPNINDTGATEKPSTATNTSTTTSTTTAETDKTAKTDTAETDKTAKTTTTTSTPATPATASASNITPLSLFPPSFAYFENVFTLQTYIVFFIVITLIFVLNSITGFTTLQPYISFIITENINLSLFLLFLVLCCKFYYTSSEDKAELVPKFLGQAKEFLTDSTSVVTILFILTIMYIFMFFIGSPLMGDGKPMSIKIVETILFIILIVIFIIFVFNNVLKMPILEWVFDNISNTVKDVSDDIKDVSLSFVLPSNQEPEPEPEVFNISNNLYTYDDAKSICSAYDASLATYDQIEKSYNGGGEWCSIGWSADQQALYPTQKSTWRELQKIKGHEHDCGRAGINGGYISNPQLRFGVNCFGKKPKPSDSELSYLEQSKNIIHPKTVKDEIMDAKVEYWKKHADKFLSINSFNKEKWSYY